MVDDYRWVLQLIDRSYGAAADDEHWPSLLKDIRSFLHAHAATLFFTNRRLQPIDRFFHENVSSEAIADYTAHFHRIDIRLHRAIPSTLNRVASDPDLVDSAEFERHEFYQDFLRPIGLRYVVSAVMGLEDGSYAFLSCHRGLNQDHVDGAILEKATLLLPHLRRSLELRRRLSTARARGQAALDLLDGLAQAVFLIGVDGRIMWQNGLADRLLDQQDGLMTSDGELVTLSATSNAELQRLIKSAVSASNRPGVRPGGMMTVPRPSLKRSYHLLVTPLPRSPEMDLAARQLKVSPSAAIFIMDMEQKSVPPTEVLRRLYHLTPAEAKLATALGSGLSVKGYAERHELSIHYVRWLLKQVEAKTDTRRLTDLIRLLARQTSFLGMAGDNQKASD